MWYIVEAPRFFLTNLFATIMILTALTFGIPPLINWLDGKTCTRRTDSVPDCRREAGSAAW